MNTVASERTSALAVVNDVADRPTTALGLALDHFTLSIKALVLAIR